MAWANEEARINHLRQIGSKGGTATVDKMGRHWMKAIGAAGFKTYADRYHDGNKAAAIEGLRAVKPRSFSKR